MRSLPWTIATIAIVAFAATFLQLHQARERYWKLAGFQSHDHMHRETREFIIRAKLDGLKKPIVIFGDSVIEMERFPEAIGDHPVVNAGIGGATIADFETIAPILLKGFDTPSEIVIALGTNDALGGISGIKRDYRTLISQLKKVTPNLVAVGVTGLSNADAVNAEIKSAAEDEGVPFLAPSIPDGAMLPDSIHLNRKGYRAWTPQIVGAISSHSS